MGANVKETISAAARQDSREIIAKSAGVHLSARLVRKPAEMELASPITRVSANQAGSESCAIKTNLGLD